MSRKIGLIVDGDGEYAAFNKRFKRDFRILKTDGPRGHTASVSKIVAKASKQVSMLSSFNCRKVVIVLDFEFRRVAYDRFVGMLQAAFGRRQWGLPVLVAVPNRMVENWYLADIAYLSQRKRFLRRNIKQKNYEGSHGKRDLKRCFVRNISYSETKHGPELFAILRFGVAGQNSASFARFLQLLRKERSAN